MKLFIKIVCFISIVSCCKDEKGENISISNNRGEITFLPYLWRIDLHKNNQINNAPFIQGNTVFGQNVMIMTTESNEKRFLTLLDSKNGSKLWDWSDFYQPLTEGADLSSFLSIENKLHWITGSRHYWIDILNGTTSNKKRRSTSFKGAITNLGKKYYTLGQPTDTLENFQTSVVYEGDFDSGNLKRVLVPNFNGNQIENRLGEATSVIPLIRNFDTLLLTAYQDIFPNYEFVSYLGLYNLTKKKWIYDKVALNEKSQKGVLYQPMEISGEKVVITVGNDILCFNYLNGEKLWQRSFLSDFSFSGFEISNGFIIANCEDSKIYGIDLNNGSIIWTSSGSGTSSNLKNRILNGYVYFSGGGPNNIFAINIQTGKTHWKLDPLLYEKNDGYWKGDILVVPGIGNEKPKVIVCSNKYAYCFEALH